MRAPYETQPKAYSSCLRALACCEAEEGYGGHIGLGECYKRAAAPSSPRCDSCVQCSMVLHS